MKKNKVLVILQNAWSPLYAGSVWPRESWLRALWRSHSGRRLSRIVDACPDINFVFDNTTPEVSEHPSIRLKPDIEHIKFLISENEPDIVVTCGKQAYEAVRLLFEPLLAIPHPACRTLKNICYDEAARLINNGISGIVELKGG